MKTRCLNKNSVGYDNYGGRGISICSEWLESYENFATWAKASGYREDLTLDRENNDDGYRPGNCRWADKHTQAQNKRNTPRLSDGRPAVRAAAENGLSYSIYRERVLKGCTPDEAATLPRQRVRAKLENGKFASDVAVENNISRGTYNMRVKYGWTPERACTEPVRALNSNLLVEP